MRAHTKTHFVLYLYCLHLSLPHLGTVVSVLLQTAQFSLLLSVSLLHGAEERWAPCLQPAAVDRQLGRSVIQTLTLGLHAGGFGALCRRRPALHPRVSPQHVDESEGWQSGSKDTSLELLAEDGRDELSSLLLTGWCRCPRSTGPLWAPWWGTWSPAAVGLHLCSLHETGKTSSVEPPLRPPHLDATSSCETTSTAATGSGWVLRSPRRRLGLKWRRLLALTNCIFRF